MGFLEVLTIVFVVLKLLGVISWNWWWVFSPLLPGLVITGLALGFITKRVLR